MAIGARESRIINYLQKQYQFLNSEVESPTLSLFPLW